ncbi:MAG TPA: PaaI family thioesterase [Actinomycetota bacterium]|nr:PaaI family thioesterase [Actinomycetota bacterium]
MTAEDDGAFRPLPSHYEHCFGCGREHPTGLHLEMEGGGGRVRGWFEVTEHHQGAPGLAHGGVIAAALDEGMGYLLWLVGSPAVTGRLEVDYAKPVPVGARLELEGWLERVEGRRISTAMVGRIAGQVAVRSRALYLKVGVEHFVEHARKVGEEMAEHPYNP